MADRRIRITVEADSDGSFDGAARGLDGLDKSADKANTSLGKLSKGHQELDKEIDKTSRSVSDLRSEFEKTGNLGLLGDVRKLEAQQAKLEKFKKSLTDVSHEVEKVGTSSTTAGDRVTSLANALRNVDTEIGRSRTLMADLASEFGQSGDTSLLSKFFDEKSTTSSLSRFRGELSKLKSDADRELKNSNKGTGLLGFALDEWVADLAKSTANGINEGFNAAIDTASHNPIISTVLIGGAILAAPIVASTIGTAIGTGVALGFGGGVIALGIKEAVADARVSAAWSDLGDKARTALTQASGPFVQPLIDGAGKVKAAFVDIEPEISAAFSTLAPTLNDLFDGAAGFTRAIGPGLDELANFSAPFLQDLATYLPQLGDHLKEFIDKVTNAGPGVENFFNDLLDLSLNAIDVMGDLVNWGARVYDVFSAVGFAAEGNLKAAGERLQDAFAKTPETFGNFRNATIDVNTALGIYNGTVRVAADGTAVVKNSVEEASGAFQKLGAATRDSIEGQAVDKLLNTTLALDQATLGFAQSQTQLGAALKTNHTELDISTAKGQALHSAVLDVVGANIRQYDSELAVSGSADQARASYDANTAALERQLQKAHLTQGQIDGLIGKYRGVPDSVNTNITLQGLTAAISNLNETLRLINGLHDKTVSINVITHQSVVQKVTQQLESNSILFNSRLHGGVVKAASGLNSGILPPRNPGTLVLAGEPGTKGEIFAPLSGISQSRAMQLGQQLGDAYDFSVTPNGYGNSVSSPNAGRFGGGSAPIALTINLIDSVTGQVIDTVRQHVNASGGNVQTALGRRGH